MIGKVIDRMVRENFPLLAIKLVTPEKTLSKEAEEGTLRNLYGTDNRKNLILGSDSAESAESKIKVFSNGEEIYGQS